MMAHETYACLHVCARAHVDAHPDSFVCTCMMGVGLWLDGRNCFSCEESELAESRKRSRHATPPPPPPPPPTFQKPALIGSCEKNCIGHPSKSKNSYLTVIPTYFIKSDKSNSHESRQHIPETS